MLACQRSDRWLQLQCLRNTASVSCSNGTELMAVSCAGGLTGIQAPSTGRMNRHGQSLDGIRGRPLQECTATCAHMHALAQKCVLSSGNGCAAG